LGGKREIRMKGGKIINMIGDVVWKEERDRER